MSDIITPDSIKFVKIFMNDSWLEVTPPQDMKECSSFIVKEVDLMPRIIITTDSQKITLDFPNKGQVFICETELKLDKKDAKINVENI